MEKNSKNARGFTLIELLVVIAIIGVLSTVVLASLNTARSKANDAKRFSDLRQMEMALDNYYADNGKYPGSTDTNCNGSTSGNYCTACSGSALPPSWHTDSVLTTALVPSYIPSVPNGPQATAASSFVDCYGYITNTSGSDYKFLDLYPYAGNPAGKIPPGTGAVCSFYDPNHGQTAWAVCSANGSGF